MTICQAKRKAVSSILYLESFRPDLAEAQRAQYNKKQNTLCCTVQEAGIDKEERYGTVSDIT